MVVPETVLDHSLSTVLGSVALTWKYSVVPVLRPVTIRVRGDVILLRVLGETVKSPLPLTVFEVEYCTVYVAVEILVQLNVNWDVESTTTVPVGAASVKVVAVAGLDQAPVVFVDVLNAATLK